MINETKKYFDENGYVVIQNLLKPEMTSLLYEYMKIKARREMLNEAYYPELFNIHINGRFDDPQALGAYSLYGDPLMDALLQNSTDFISKTIEVDLVPTYSYWRLYITGNELKKHKDRPSCEYSSTLCIGYDGSNLDDKNYNWPIHIKSLKGEDKSVLLNPGDLVIYKGCDVEHWRDKYDGLNHAQVFLHYNKRNGEYGNIYDGREFLGLQSTD
tara:strand:- start:241 stop:882 length:642 start_codon:yes stop_codon:yes gene_type:complete